MNILRLKFDKSELPEFLHEDYDYYGGYLELEKFSKRQICKFKIPNLIQKEGEPIDFAITMYKEVDGPIVDCYDFLLGALLMTSSTVKLNESRKYLLRYNVMLAGIHIARNDTELFNLVVLPYFDLILGKILGGE